jgi:hypothetical protein
VKSDLTEVILFDDTADIVLKLWGDLGLSAREWKPNVTILLISSPSFRMEYRGRESVGLTHSSMVDVDPEFPGAEWLRKYAAQLNKRESLDEVVPEGVWDLEDALFGRERVLYTIADVDYL